MELATILDLQLSRLMLGTVQLGLEYGIANSTGQPAYGEARRIIACAHEGGVNCFDTAAAYGVSEEVLGRALAELGIAEKVTVVSKVHHLAQGLDATTAARLAEESVVRSLKRLRLQSLPICLFHIEGNFCYVDALLELKERGLVRHIGCSVMTPAATAAIVESGLAEAFQIPTSVLDRRFSHPDRGLIGAAHARGAAVFARSIYLQGLMLMPESAIPGELAEVIPVRRRIAFLADQAGIAVQELALRYVLGLDGVASCVVGVESVDQMRDNLTIANKGPLEPGLRRQVEASVLDLPDKIRMPNQWPRGMQVQPLGKPPA